MNEYEQQSDPDYRLDQQPTTRRVGGWMLFYCLITVFGVLKSFQTIAATKAPLFLALYITLSLLSMLACIAVWMRAASALTWVSFSLCARFMYGLFQVLLGARMSNQATNTPMSPSQTEFSLAVANLLGAVVWFLYFHLSVRVRETLGRNL